MKPNQFVVISTFLSLVFAASTCAAFELNANSKREITLLLTRLGQSGCQFNRNGSWYTAQEAQAHLTKKLEYVNDKNLVSSAEQFIDTAASKSSISGQAYMVRCGSLPALSSSVWLQTALKEIRQMPAKP